MQLIGMLDSPYVRRAAISLDLLGIAFEHRPVSVFSTFETFQAINPVVKAPSLICDDGSVLMDSTLIIDYAESLADPAKTLLPRGSDFLRTLRLTGLALAACEKAVQIVYERNLRPVAKQHEPWLTRVRGQLLAALRLLEAEIAAQRPLLPDARPSQAAIAAAVMWQFVHSMVQDVVKAEQYPHLVALSTELESSPSFAAFPPEGPGVARS